MPKYFFDFREGGVEHRDSDGTPLDSFHHARAEAIKTLCEMAQEAAPLDGDHYELTVMVRDAEGVHLLEVGLTFDAEHIAPN